MSPGGSEAVVIVNAAVTEMAQALFAVAEDESDTITVNEKLPACVGVPDRAPELPLSERPPGSDPDADQEYGGAPPEAVAALL